MPKCFNFPLKIVKLDAFWHEMSHFVQLFRLTFNVERLTIIVEGQEEGHCEW